MTDTNKVILLGRITKDLDENSFGYIASGQARANISIAVNRSQKQGDNWVDETSFFDVTIWGKTAENLKPYLTKGRQIIIDGYLKQDRWEKGGQKFSKVSIVAENVQLCGNKDSASVSTTNFASPITSKNQETDFGAVSNDTYEDDIPF